MNEQINFRTAVLGYRKAEVKEYLARITREFEAAREELGGKTRELSTQNEGLGKKLEELKAQVARHQEQEQIIARILVEAQVRAVAIESEAKQKAESIEQQVLAEIAIKRAELNNIRLRVEEFKKEFGRMLDSYRASLSSGSDPMPSADSFFVGTDARRGGD